MQSDDVSTRRQAVQNLRHATNISQANHALIAQYHRETNVSVLRTIVLALGKFGHFESLPTILQALEHNNIWIRRASVQAIADGYYEQAIPELVNLLDDPELQILAQESLKRLKVDPNFF